jgi:AcrR family transcriptional regulator
MNAGRTARDRARAELTQEIKDAARRQLAVEGAERLSLRAVSRELGMVSSALYRYFPSRDELLTALIIDAYDALGAAAEQATRQGQDPRTNWQAVCRAVRAWAVAHPHEYALIYGSPVAGYSAPPSTIQPAGRVATVLLGLIRQAHEAGILAPLDDAPAPSGVLDEQIAGLAASAAPGVPAKVLTRAVIAWTQLFGMISFELFGQLVGSVDPSEPFFDYATAQMADFLGLAPAN